MPTEDTFITSQDLVISLYYLMTCLILFCHTWMYFFIYWFICHKLYCTTSLPVLILSWFADIHDGKHNPKNKETPKMKMFLDDLMSTYCKLDSPTAVIIPVLREIFMFG